MIRFFDGGMGSMLNLKAGELPEKLNISDPERVFAVHEGYAKAGAEFITATHSAQIRLNMTMWTSL